MTKTVIALLLVGSLAACASSVKLKETWRAPDAAEGSYKKLLVVAITHNQERRKTFENIFSEALRQQGVAAVSSLTLIDDNSKVSRAQMLALVDQVDADGVVITRVLSRAEKDNANYAAGNYSRRTAAATSSGSSSSGVVMSTVGYVPGQAFTGKATLETLLFDAASTQLVWSVLSEAEGVENQEVPIFWKLSAELSRKMGEEKLIVLNGKKVEMPTF